MKTNLLLMLPCMMMATAAWGQPEYVELLSDGSYRNAAADVNGTLYFSEFYDLVRHDGQNTYRPAYVDGKAINLTNVNGVLYFTVFNEAKDEATLWRSDATETIPVIRFTDTFHQISRPVNIGNAIYFAYQDKLYKTDGTEAGTVVVKDLDPSANVGSLRLVKAENTLYGNLRKGDDHYELWRSDGTETGTSFLRSFRFIEFLSAARGAQFFVGDDGGTGKEIWRATPSGVVQIADINPEAGSSFGEGSVSAPANEIVMFATTTPAAVWVVTPGAIKLATVGASEIARAGETFYFINENELWKSNGTPWGTVLVKEFSDADTHPRRLSNLTTHGKTVFFAVDGKELWQSDGSAWGTILISDHGQGANSTGMITPISVGERLYYFAAFGTSEYSEQPVLLSYDPNSLWIPSMQLVDYNTDEDVRILQNHDVIYTDEKFSIRADASLASDSVTFHIDGALSRRESARPFSLAGDNNGNYFEWNISPGSHQIRAIPYNASGTAGKERTYNISVVARQQGCATGTIVREYWSGIAGNSISAIPVYTRPSGSQTLTLFEAPANIGRQYGARIKGFICPPASGNYTFWISSNDHSELWLSSDADPRNKERIAYVSGATDPRQWDKFHSQKSFPIHLEAGQRYYIEALHKQGDGTDHVAVGWQLPGGEMERPIPSGRISPFSGNYPPEVKLTSPLQDQAFIAPATIHIVAEGGDQDGRIARHELYVGDRLVEEYFSEFTWTNVPEGTYVLTARVFDDDGATTTSDPVTVTVSSTGTIVREHWTGIQGDRVSLIPVDEPPAGQMNLSLFEGPENFGRNYGARIRGYVSPPSSGEYVFWIASNDNSELWLSTDADPAKKKRIAYVSHATASREWNKFASQKSVAVFLQDGKKYYIEALHKQGVGTDNLAVGWQLPDGTLERPIPGNRLSRYTKAGEPAEIITPANGSEGLDPLVMKFEVRSVPNASRYTVEVSTQENFSGSSILLNSIEDHQRAFILKDLEHATTYYSRVKTNVTGFGPVSTFTTRAEIPHQRLWGLTTAGGREDMGTIFSFSIDSTHFVKHHDKPVHRDEYDEGEEDDVVYEENLTGTPVAGPDGTLYGQSDHDYTYDMFVMKMEGEVQWLAPLVFIYGGNIMLGSDNSIYVNTLDYLAGGAISKYYIDDPLGSRQIKFFEPKEYGHNPAPRLLELSDGYFYGAAIDGGLNNGGVLYRIRGSGAAFEIIHYFNTAHGGMNPHSGLTEANGLLYGTTAYGGAAENTGTIFRIQPDGTSFTKLHDFDGINGRNPFGEVIVWNGKLYGVTTEGGTSDLGVIYSMNPDGSGFTKLHDFSGFDGAIPSGTLTHDKEGNLYGMTSAGGVNGMGVIFRIHSSGTGFAKLFDFSSGSGGRPNGSLVIREDTFSPPSTSAMAMKEMESDLSVSIHPNPSTDNFSVYVQSPDEEKIQLLITDQYGDMVTSYEITNETPTEVGSELKRGLYIMKIMQGEHITMKRVVKK